MIDWYVPTCWGPEQKLQTGGSTVNLWVGGDHVTTSTHYDSYHVRRKTPYMRLLLLLLLAYSAVLR